jgi:hypothetical protein
LTERVGVIFKLHAVSNLTSCMHDMVGQVPALHIPPKVIQ